MSKMSQLHAELEEQAVEKGYESLDHFLECGGEIDMVHGKLVNSASELEKAHEAWLEEKHQVLHTLESIKEDIIDLNNGDNNHVAIDELNYVIDFIEKGEC